MLVMTLIGFTTVFQVRVNAGRLLLVVLGNSSSSGAIAPLLLSAPLAFLSR
jgi:hypothetical protein